MVSVLLLLLVLRWRALRRVMLSWLCVWMLRLRSSEDLRRWVHNKLFVVEDERGPSSSKCLLYVVPFWWKMWEKFTNKTVAVVAFNELQKEKILIHVWKGFLEENENYKRKTISSKKRRHNVVKEAFEEKAADVCRKIENDFSKENET